MPDDQMTALRENFFYFQGVVRHYISQHRGRYALLHAQEVVEIFDRPVDAAQAGISKFPDGRFSVQKVADRPADLGFMAYGPGDRAPN